MTHDREPFGYWVEQKHADPVLLRRPAYIPEPSDLRTVTPLYLGPSDPSGIVEGRAREDSVVDRARALIVNTLRDDARQYAPIANGKGSYEYLADMASKVERAEAVPVDSYLVLDCVIAALSATTAPELEGWQDIASAPRDGTPLILIDMNAATPEASSGYFWDGIWSCNEPNSLVPASAIRWDAPTHWRYPPAPPARQALAAQVSL